MTTRVAIAGAAGRLGHVIAEVVRESPGFELVAELGSANPPERMLEAEVLVDATNLDASKRLVAYAVEHGLPALVATSGWDEGRLRRLETTLAGLGPEAPGVIVVPNFSLGSVLGTRLAATAARFFDAVEVIEAHHAGKADSPSGTAVRTAERIAAARAAAGLGAPAAANAEQEARGELIAGVPVHSLRLPGVVARQQVVFGGIGETLAIDHTTLSADSYRAGIRLALQALPEARGLTVGLDALLGLE